MDEELTTLQSWPYFLLYLRLRQQLLKRFRQRQAESISCVQETLLIEQQGRRVWLLCDLKLSHQILHHSAFEVENIFAHYRQQPETRLDRYLSSSLLYIEGEAHKALKKRQSQTLQSLNLEAQKLEKPLHALFKKRCNQSLSALGFAEMLVRHCFARLIQSLCPLSLLALHRLLRQRSNVFEVLLHPDKFAHNAALIEHLFSPLGEPSLDSETGQKQHLAMGLLVNGYDPLIAAICTALSNDNGLPFSQQVHQWGMVSYTHRRCTSNTHLGNTPFRKGDLVFCSLVPSTDEASTKACPMTFGTGQHACVGKHLSLTLLDISQRIAADCYPQGFAPSLKIENQGSFLQYHETDPGEP